MSAHDQRHALIASVQRIGPPPCDAPTRCIHYERCKHQKLACWDFYEYVSMAIRVKRSRHPSRCVYVRIFNRHDDGMETNQQMVYPIRGRIPGKQGAGSRNTDVRRMDAKEETPDVYAESGTGKAGV